MDGSYLSPSSVDSLHRIKILFKTKCASLSYYDIDIGFPSREDSASMIDIYMDNIH